MHHIVYLNTVKILKSNSLREAHTHSHCFPKDPILSFNPHALKKKIYIHIFCTVKMTQQIKALVTRLNDLNLIPETGFTMEQLLNAVL